jgi:imidazole glycerol-phosphate synthase subunit HisF
MLKKRLIACLLIQNGQIVQSIGFKEFLVVGNAILAVEHFNAWAIDEIVILDINREKNYDFWRPDVNYDNTLTEFHELIRYVSSKAFIPITAGGGIRSIDDIRQYIHEGADRVSINSAAINTPDIITKGATMFGTQCIVVSIDAKRQPDGSHHVMTDFGAADTGTSVVEWAKEVEALGAGEIFLTSVDCDGAGQGYDIGLIQSVTDVVRIPVIASGGVGDWSHLISGIRDGGASAVSVGNKFHFTEHSTMHAKRHMKEHGIDVR